MDKTTFFRCGIVWFVCALFLYDGGKFVRAQEQPAPNKVDVADDSSKETEKNGDTKRKKYSIPDWFDTSSNFTDANRMLFVKTKDSSSTITDAKEELAEACRDAIDKSLRSWLEIAQPQILQFDDSYILENLVYENRIEFRQDPECKREAEEIGGDVDFFVGYTQLRLDDEFRSVVGKQLAELQTRRRLVKGGLVGGFVLTLLTVMFGYLKMETATRGFYSRRLQTASIAIAIALLTALYFASQHLT